jgi:hypothetical protein
MTELEDINSLLGRINQLTIDLDSLETDKDKAICKAFIKLLLRRIEGLLKDL